MFPKDPNMLVSYINLKLRDEYDSFEELCDSNDEDPDEITELLKKAGYKYDPLTNSFR